MVNGFTWNGTHCGSVPVFKRAVEIERTSRVLSKDSSRNSQVHKLAIFRFFRGSISFVPVFLA